VKHEVECYRTRLPTAQAAQQYATRFERGTRRRTDLREQRAIEKICTGLIGCRRGLDVPCGAGRFSATLARHWPELILMDTSEAVLELARARLAELRIDGHVTAGDASRMPLESGSVDVVFSNRLLHHIDRANERLMILAEFWRVATRHLIVSFFDYRRFGPLRAWLKRLKGRKVDYSGKPTQSQFLAELAQSGFALNRIVPIGPPWVAQQYIVLDKAPDLRQPGSHL
jgi:ubiquinone/menaquinone biosynthesis C-methylase UbiE